MIRLITLHGEMSGSARVNMTERGTQVTLSLRGKRGEGALTAYLIGDDRILAVPLNGLSGNAEPLDVRGVLVAKGSGGNSALRGEFAAWGSCCGMTNEALNKAKAKVRMMLPGSAMVQKANESGKAPAGGGRSAKSPETAPKGDAGGSIKRGGAAESDAASDRAGLEKRLSPVTESILDKARELFAGLMSDYAGNVQNSDKQPDKAAGARDGKPAAVNVQNKPADAPEVCENCAAADEEAVMNPFPGLFPNSYWKRKIGDDAKLYGVANLRGVKYDIMAVRSASRYPPRGLRGNLRRARARNGYMYWLGLVRK